MRRLLSYFSKSTLFMKWGSSELIIHCNRMLVSKFSWIFYGEFPYYCLNIVVNISSFSPLNINVTTTLKYYCKQALNKKLNLMGGAMNFFMNITFFMKKLQDYEIFSSKIPWVKKYFLKNLENPSAPILITYILNVHSLLL